MRHRGIEGDLPVVVHRSPPRRKAARRHQHTLSGRIRCVWFIRLPPDVWSMHCARHMDVRTAKAEKNQRPMGLCVTAARDTPRFLDRRLDMTAVTVVRDRILLSK
jgi:hypothetical protein